MNRFLFALAMTLVASAPMLAQDMPLAQILIDSEGWKKVEGKRQPGSVEMKVISSGGDAAPLQYDVAFASGQKFRISSLPGVGRSLKGGVANPARWDQPIAALITQDGGTLYIGGAAQRHLWAYRVDKDGKASRARTTRRFARSAESTGSP